jgi:hypothetical protein
MKHPRLFYLLSILCFASCQGNTPSQPETNQATPAPEVTETTASSDCYRAISGKDSVLIHLRTTGQNVQGDLIYSFFEKDNNTGTLSGTFSGDTLFAEYNFMSEGQESVREVAFLKKGNALVEGFGPVKENAGKMEFENRNALEFNGKLSYQSTDCQSDEHGCVALTGYHWSQLKKDCIRPAGTAIRLNAGAELSSKAKPAFLLFSDDQQQAELFLPGSKASLLLQRQGTEGSHHWESGDWKLYPWKGYVLKQKDQLAYAGQ